MIPLRIRKEVCENIGIEFRPYEATENTIEVDIDGQKTLKARSNPKKNYREAEAWARSIRNAFKRKENRARSRLDAAQTA